MYKTHLHAVNTEWGPRELGGLSRWLARSRALHVEVRVGAVYRRAAQLVLPTHTRRDFVHCKW